MLGASAIIAVLLSIVLAASPIEAGIQDHELQTVVFREGTRLEVRRYEVRDAVVVFTRLDGRLQSVALDLIDLAATESANGCRFDNSHRTFCEIFSF